MTNEVFGVLIEVFVVENLKVCQYLILNLIIQDYSIDSFVCNECSQRDIPVECDLSVCNELICLYVMNVAWDFAVRKVYEKCTPCVINLNYFCRILLSGMNDQNQDLEEMDHRLLTYISIFHTMYVDIGLLSSVYWLIELYLVLIRVKTGYM